MTDETDHSHRVVRKRFRRTWADEVFESGDPITPTDRELRRFGDGFEPMEGESADESPASEETPQVPSESQSEPTEEPTESTEPTDPQPDESTDTEPADSGSDSTPEADAEPETDTFDPETDDPHTLTDELLDALDYAALRTLAGRTKNIDGRQGADKLRKRLREVYKIK